ncbi:MAG: nitroreductase family protein, partial [Ruminococcus sp.]
MMDLAKAIKERHSVRSYEDRPLDTNVKDTLKEKIAEYNSESGLHIQLVCDEPKAFDCFMAHYGKFSGVTNYIAMVGKKGKKLDELCGYYGEKLALLAQQLGLNTCWVAMSYKKIPGVFEIESDEKLAI